ncbi:protein ORF57 [Cyprinid herpesvirus 1]|uniref:Protein ORF57 n=1 Tax=Cyprinid herpesvirus 1 TaxID=317858 RepID=K7PC68_9VIRU|nr:protein ORF57 [Cyprinid herpesvirus 1]AFJ20357.1 protein ORF57 [Cyprinid herpesvirus 1]
MADAARQVKGAADPIVPLPAFLENCTPSVCRAYGVQPGDFPPYVIAQALSKKAFDMWTQFDFEALRLCLNEKLHLQATASHKLYVVACGMILWGEECWMDPQMLSRVFVHDAAKLKLLARVVYSFMMCLQVALEAKEAGSNIPGLDDPARVDNMKRFVQLKGFHHHYTFCDHHWQHWTMGREHADGELPEVVVREMITDGLSCSLERGGPFSSAQAWIHSFRFEFYPEFMRDQLREALKIALENALRINFVRFTQSVRFLAKMHRRVEAPRWGLMPPNTCDTLETYEDCLCDVHVLRHVAGVTSCDCLCCRRHGCSDENCRPTAQMSKAELQAASEDNDDLESTIEALGATPLNMKIHNTTIQDEARNMVHRMLGEEPRVVAVKAKLLGVGDRGPNGKGLVCDCPPCDCTTGDSPPCECPPCDCPPVPEKKKLKKPKKAKALPPLSSTDSSRK